jgi:predicted amidophosphoribosyltransferase
MPCVVCGTGDQPCCDSCWPQPKITVSDLGGLPKISGTEYPQIRDFLLPFKDDGLYSMATVLAPIVRAALQAVLEQVSENRPITVVYPPSTRANFRRRGFNPAERLLKRAITDAGIHAAKGFAWQRGVSDQGALDREGRKGNLDGSLRSVLRGNSGVLVFDDVTASGATLQEMGRALVENDNRLLGYCVLAESFLKMEPSTAQ